MKKQIKTKQSFDPKLFLEAINEISKRNLLKEEELKNIIENAFFKTFHSKVDPDANLELNIDLDNKIFKLINHSKLVVSNQEFDEEFSSSEISLKEALKIKENVKEGDEVSQSINLSGDKKFIIQVKQLILQNIREKKKEAIYLKYKDLKDTMIFAEVIASRKNGHAILKLEDDGIIAYMPPKLKNQNIDLKIGERIKVYVEEILKESKDSQIIVSNGSPNMLKEIIKANVPEVEDGIIEIVKISRIPGLRSKVAVKTQDENVDPVGAIIGAGGNRIKAILSKLNGEKIDVIAWSEDGNKYIANSLSPARVISVLPKKENNEIIENQKVIITPNIHQTLAIGQLGSNARLAVELTNNRLDIISLDKAKEEGIEIIWNGNVKEEELENIEKNIKTRTKNIRRNNLTFDFSNEINDFSESINSNFSEEDEDDKNLKEYEIEDDMFSSEELKKMENNFELDPELMAFDPDKEEDFD